MQKGLRKRKQLQFQPHRSELWARNQASDLSHAVLLHSHCMLHQHLISTPKSLSYYSFCFSPLCFAFALLSQAGRQSSLLKSNDYFLVLMECY